MSIPPSLPRVLLLTGTCGSGKSTIAGLLEARGWTRISEDEIWPRHFGKDRGTFGSPEHRRKRQIVHEIVFGGIRTALDDGCNVVVDATVHESPPEAFEEYRAFFLGECIAWRVRVLHPSVEVAVVRDRTRAQGSLGAARVAALHAKFTGLVFPPDAFVDTSVHTPAETLSALLRSGLV
jgi:predicted kinase